jgi:Beta-propeller repeat
MPPLAFEANRGQAPVGVDFVAHGRDYTAEIRANRVILGLSRAPSDASGEQIAAAHDVVEIGLTGANRGASATGQEKLPGHTNYLLGTNPAGWITNVEQYARVRYANVYPGIDLVFHGNDSRLEHDFVLDPGASAAQIGLTFSGIRRAELQSDGDLVLHAESGEMPLERPRAYQVIGSKEVEVAAAYALRKGSVGFRLGRCDRRQTLTIDPVLVYSTFFGGGTGSDGVQQQITAIAVDAAGNLYAVGNTTSTSFPITSGVVEPNPAPVFISKFNPTGTSLIFSTYMQGFSYAPGLAVDAQGDVYIAGVGQPGLPIPHGSNPFQANPKSLAVLKLNSTGTAVLNATYIGGSRIDSLSGLAIDTAGDVYLTGTTSSNDFPVQNPLQGTLGTSGSSGFVTEFNPSLSALIYSTYLGANSDVAEQPVEGGSSFASMLPGMLMW